jgi:hypothetical protein
MAYRHDSIEAIIFRSCARTALDAIKSTGYPDDPTLESFIQSVCEMADDYEKKFCGPRSRGWSNQ